MTALMLLAAATAGGAGALLLPLGGGLPQPTRRERAPTRRREGGDADGGRGAPGWRHPWVRGALAAAGVVLVLPGALGWVAALPVGVWMHGRAAAARSARSRRATGAASAELPVLVDLVAGALASGAPVERALETACAAWPGAAADRLTRARSRLALGGDPVSVWEGVAADPVLARLGRAMARATSSGAPVADVVARLADDLADRSRADAEDRARAVGVRAAVPLGLCLLPAFVLLGIVPLAAGLFASLT